LSSAPDRGMILDEVRNMAKQEQIILVQFWLNGQCVFTWYTGTFPCYRRGDTLWLEKKNTMGQYALINKDVMALTKFEIVDIQHSIEKEYGDSVESNCHLEIYIEER
jgi:hypothetical protein